MVRIGLLGAGHLGKIHLKLLKQIEDFEVVGFYDVNPENAAKVAEEYGVPAFSEIEALIDQVDALDIVTPTLSHFDCAKLALEKGKHIFIEKPLTNTLEEAETLLKMVEASDVVGQVGHVERFNPAFLSVEHMELKPMFLEGHRLAMYNPRGTDVSVVLDLMIHDLDVILSMVDSPVRQIRASGVAVISDTPDIANARIEFENGCVANLTASRISIKNMRRLRIIQEGGYVAVDFLKKKSEVFRIREENEVSESTNAMKFEMGEGEEKKFLVFEMPEVAEGNAILMELQEFGQSILTGSPVRVSIRDGYRALKTAHMILEEIDQLAQRVAQSKH